MAGGRPTEYKPEYCDQLAALGRSGLSLTQMAAHFCVSKQTFYTWRDAHPEFLDALQESLTFAQAHWEEIHYKGARGELPVNAAVLNKAMSARFRDEYTERQQTELTGKDGGPVQVAHSTLTEAELDERIAALSKATGIG